jgi:hypothetical protein
MSTEIATQNNSADIISGGYSSVKATNAAEAARLYGAVSNAASLKDAVNTEITVVDVIVRPAEFADDNGLVTERLVTTLIAEDGKAYASNSPTVADSVRDLMVIMGEPRTGFWGKGLKVVPKLRASGNNRSFISLTLPEAK